MERWKKILLKLVLPPIAVAAVLIPLGFGLVICSVVFAQEYPILAYISYGLSAYSLVLLCFRLPRIIRFFRNFQQNNPFMQRYLSDAQYRVRISLYSALAINLLYAALQLGSGIYYHSVWFYALAGYYAILAVTRYFLLKETLKHRLGKDRFWEYLHYRFCGILLVLLNLALGIIITYIVVQNRGFAHNEIITIAMAAYTFFSVTMAVINLVKHRGNASPVLSAATVLSLVSALVSLLSLETAMLSAFGTEDDALFRQIITGATGFVVFVAVFTMAVYMIVHSTKEIKKLKGAHEDGAQ